MEDKVTKNLIPRPPVVAVMGHINHGKSTLIDYIRQTAETEKEAGGITQHIGAYEVKQKDKTGKWYFLTFLDTPGHEAFAGIRRRGVTVADIAILVVSAEEGVKQQTLEALRFIKEMETPYIVAITKIDRPSADPERTKQNLAENGIYVEGYGGKVPVAALSAKTGKGVPELLELIHLVAEMEELKGDRNAALEGILIESRLDQKKGWSGTVIVKNGVLKKGSYLVCGAAFTPTRIMENSRGEAINEASFGSPVRIIGWSTMPPVGEPVEAFKTKKAAEEAARLHAERSRTNLPQMATNSNAPAIAPAGAGTEDRNEILIPIVVKADTSGSLEAIEHEIGKIQSDQLRLKIIRHGVGAVTDGDVKNAISAKAPFILNFNSKVEKAAKRLADQLKVEIASFEVIYKLIDWLKVKSAELVPKRAVEEIIGAGQIIKLFGQDKDRQIVGGRVVEGSLNIGADLKIFRRNQEISRGKIRNLQQRNVRVESVQKGGEFGAMVESKIAVAPGDRIEAVVTTFR